VVSAKVKAEELKEKIDSHYFESMKFSKDVLECMRDRIQESEKMVKDVERDDAMKSKAELLRDCVRNLHQSAEQKMREADQKSSEFAEESVESYSKTLTDVNAEK